MKLEEGGYEERYKKVYGNAKITISKAFEAQPVDAFVKVDMKIPGCPIDKGEFLRAVSKVVAGRHPYLVQVPRVPGVQVEGEPLHPHGRQVLRRPSHEGRLRRGLPDPQPALRGLLGTDGRPERQRGVQRCSRRRGTSLMRSCRKIKKFGGAERRQAREGHREVEGGEEMSRELNVRGPRQGRGRRRHNRHARRARRSRASRSTCTKGRGSSSSS